MILYLIFWLVCNLLFVFVGVFFVVVGGVYVLWMFLFDVIFDFFDV